jgi:hypothetical protein
MLVALTKTSDSDYKKQITISTIEELLEVMVKSTCPIIIMPKQGFRRVPFECDFIIEIFDNYRE